MFFKKILLFSIVFSILFSFQSSNRSHAAGRLETCAPLKAGDSPSSSDSLDGSDCTIGLVCDKFAKLCVYPSEIACKGSGGFCTVGTACMDDEGQLLNQDSDIGTCQPYSGSSAENNAISDVLCNVYKFGTGKTGRIVIGIVFIGAGGTFLFGKMQLGTLMAITIGSSLIFGGPAIVSVLVGKGFSC